MKKKLFHILLGFIILSSIIFSSYNLVSAADDTLYVDDDYDESTDGWEVTHFDNIQDAISNANESDIIVVKAGSYIQNVEVSKTLTLQGEGKNKVTLDGAPSGSGPVMEITANNIILTGFTIQNAVGSGNDCLYLNEADNCEITDNIFKGSEQGIYLKGSDSNTISDNSIEDNSADGIYGFTSSDNTISNNIISDNQNGLGLDYGCSNNIISNNEITGKSSSISGIYLRPSTSNNQIYGNEISDFDDNAEDPTEGQNTWYKESTQEGNYWDDYTGEDANDDGIGDTPYTIDDNVEDKYPIYKGSSQPSQNQKPVAHISSINPNPANQGTTVYFSGYGSDDGYIQGYKWTSSLQGTLESSKTFNTADLTIGTHTISFTVKDNQGEWSNPDTQQLIINSPDQENTKPIAHITSPTKPTALKGEKIFFKGYGEDPDENGYIVGYNWRSNIDGTISGDDSFYYSKLSVGTHKILFKVRDNTGEWSDEDSFTIVVSSSSGPGNQLPIVKMGGPYTGAVNTSVSFDASNCYDPDQDTIVSYKWDFGDGTNETGMYADHMYTSIGEYTVTLTIQDSFGNVNSSSETIFISLTGGTNNNNDGNDGLWDIPGFEILLIIISILLIFFIKTRR